MLNSSKESCIWSPILVLFRIFQQDGNQAKHYEKKGLLLSHSEETSRQANSHWQFSYFFPFTYNKRADVRRRAERRSWRKVGFHTSLAIRGQIRWRTEGLSTSLESEVHHTCRHQDHRCQQTERTDQNFLPPCHAHYGERGEEFDKWSPSKQHCLLRLESKMIYKCTHSLCLVIANS